MIRPPTIPAAKYPIARKPALGYESHLYFSLEQTAEPGYLEITGQNTGTLTLNPAEEAVLDASPMELLAVLDTDIDCGSAAANTPLTVTVTGKDQNNANVTGVATFVPPGHAAMTYRRFPRTWSAAVETTPADKKFKAITSVSVAAPASATGAAVKLFGIPARDTFTEVACKTQCNVQPKIPMPHSIACGRDLSAYTKPGEIPEGTVSISGKSVTTADGLVRVNGTRVTGLIVTKKEDKLETDYLYLIGLTVAVRFEIGDGVSEQMLTGEGKTEETAMVLAP